MVRSGLRTRQPEWRTGSDTCARVASADLEWLHGRNSLRIQPSVDLHPAFGMGANVPAGLAQQCFKPWEYRHVHFRLSLLPNHDQPGWFRLAQRIFMGAAEGSGAGPNGLDQQQLANRVRLRLLEEEWRCPQIFVTGRCSGVRLPYSHWLP